MATQCFNSFDFGPLLHDKIDKLLISFENTIREMEVSFSTLEGQMNQAIQRLPFFFKTCVEVFFKRI